MDNSRNYSCTYELAAESLMAITSCIIASVILCNTPIHLYLNIFTRKILGTVLSSAYALFLPLMSYMFSQVRQIYPEGRAQLILVWMVFIELIQVQSAGSDWELKKSAAQLVRLLWVSYLVYGNTPLNGLRASLLAVCAYSITFEILTGVASCKAKDSYSIGKNAKLIQNYMKELDDLTTTPLDKCDYIVMGEENHEIDICENGCNLGRIKSNSEGKLTIGRVFQHNSSEDETCTLAHPDWRDTCLSLALSKMLMRRFVNLPLNEVGSRKALEFVREGLVGYIGCNEDIPLERRNGARNPADRVFCIIQNELRFVSEFSHAMSPAYIYYSWYKYFVLIGFYIPYGTGFYFIYTICKKSSTWLSHIAQDVHSHCFFHIFGRGSIVMKIFSSLDIIITILLFLACIYMGINLNTLSTLHHNWSNFNLVKKYMENPAKFSTSHSSATINPAERNTTHSSLVGLLLFRTKIIKEYSYNPVVNPEQARIQNSIFDTSIENVYRLIVNVTFLAPFVKWISRIFFSKAPTTEVNKAILNSLKTKFERGGQLTNGETALKRHGIWEHLDFVYRPNTSITEAILVWHIATTLFHLKSPPEKKNDVFEKDRKVALTLSRYCHYLVAFLPELLPDEVEWVKNLYKGVREEISVIGRSSGQETQDPRRRNHYNYMMGEEVTWNEKPVLEKGAKLAKMLLELAASSYDMEGQAGNGTKVWTMLSEFWVEMLLFMAPSDNVKGHEEILENNELITQLWALLTHAGILTRSQFIPPPNCETERNEVTQDRSTNTQHPDNGSESNEITEE